METSDHVQPCFPQAWPHPGARTPPNKDLDRLIPDQGTGEPAVAHPSPANYTSTHMVDSIPVLLGTAGLVQGESYLLAPGSAVVIGRSRSCDISLRRTTGYIKAPADLRDNDHDFNTVSRRHARVEVTNSKVRIEDLSTNGTYVNGEHLNGSTEVDLGTGICNLRLGTRESFDLVLLAKDDPRLNGIQSVTASPTSDDTSGRD